MLRGCPADFDDFVCVYAWGITLSRRQGPGAEMRQALGTAVFSGMIGVNLFAIFLTPVFFSVIMKFFGPKPAVSLSPELNETITANTSTLPKPD
jgi:hypothetical protein